MGCLASSLFISILYIINYYCCKNYYREREKVESILWKPVRQSIICHCFCFVKKYLFAAPFGSNDNHIKSVLIFIIIM
jgi:hypothetical protein